MALESSAFGICPLPYATVARSDSARTGRAFALPMVAAMTWLKSAIAARSSSGCSRRRPAPSTTQLRGLCPYASAHKAAVRQRLTRGRGVMPARTARGVAGPVFSGNRRWPCRSPGSEDRVQIRRSRTRSIRLASGAAAPCSCSTRNRTGKRPWASLPVWKSHSAGMSEQIRGRGCA